MRHYSFSKIFYLLLVFFISGSFGYDEVIPDRNAPINHRPKITHSHKGNTIVNISAPNENGISFNEYLRFDIPKDGVVLNNSSKKSRTSNGELIRGNRNLINGSADLIVNKINSNRPSFLNGNLEIAGKRADLIMANPSGITIDGLNVINARSTTITTANPIFDGKNINALELTKQSKSVNIVGAGFNDMQSDYTKIIANVIKINADVWAKHIKLNAGVADKKGHIREKNEPLVTIDSSYIGGMFKGAIVLIGNEDGVGSNNKRFIHADKFSIQAKKRIITADTSNLNNHSDNILGYKKPDFEVFSNENRSECKCCHTGVLGGGGGGGGKGGGSKGGGSGGWTGNRPGVVESGGSSRPGMGNNIGVGFKEFGGDRDISMDFLRKASLPKHFKDHNKNFGFATQEEYLEAARYFFSKPPTPTMQSFTTQEGTYFQFDTATNEFGIINQYGGISTYYIPDDKLDYWLGEIKKYAPQ